MDRIETEAPIDLRDYLVTLKARKWTVLLVTMLVIGASLAMSSREEPLYRARTKLLVEPVDLSTSVPRLINLDTESEVLASSPVAALVREDLELGNTGLTGSLSVSGLADTEVLEVVYTDRDPEFAAQAANSFAENYINFKRSRALEDVLADEQAVQDQIERASSQLSDITAQLKAAEKEGDEGLAATLETSRSVLIARLGVLQQQLDQLQADRSRKLGGGEIIEPAVVPSAPFSPNHLKSGILGLILGMALGIGLAFLRERLDDRFRSRSDVEVALQVPVLATVPSFGTSRKKQRDELITVSDPKSVAAEAYRTLRTNIQFIASQRDTRSILVTSPSASEGKTVTSANLTHALAQAGRRVIVVSSDLRRPTLEGYFFDSGATPHDEGLSTWLASEADVSSIIRDPGVANVRVIPSGPIPPNPAELLSSPRLLELIGILERHCDLVIFDSPPVLAVADSAIIASRVGGTVLILNAESTHKSASVHAKEELERVGAQVLGTVLNDFDVTSSPYYYGSYEYYGSPQPEERASNGRGEKSPTAKTKKTKTKKKSRSLFASRK